MTTVQEGAQNDEERLFGVLQGRFAILRSDRHEWSDTELVEIVDTPVIPHNMLLCMRINRELSDKLDNEGNLLHPER